MADTILSFLGVLAFGVLSWYARGWWNDRKPTTGVLEAKAAAEAFALGHELLAKAKKLQADPSATAAIAIAQATVDAHIKAAEETLAAK